MNLKGLAWLQGGVLQRTLRIERWAAAPTTGGCSFYAPDFALKSEQPWMLGQVVDWPTNIEGIPLPPSIGHKAPNLANFAGIFESLMAQIKLRELAKAVPIVGEHIEFEAPIGATMFPRALKTFPEQFNYGFDHNAQGMCGVSPELLFKVDGDELHTMALAGTGPAAGKTLLTDEKELHEHSLVIEDIVNVLHDLGTVDVEPTREQIYGSLKHLRTPIRVKLEKKPDFLELVRRLHPTAALGGWPKEKAWNWLEQQDFHRWRGRFGAPFGFIDGETMMCVVAIRGLQWQGSQALLASGCGIVAQSILESEWKELQLKRLNTARFLGLP